MLFSWQCYAPRKQFADTVDRPVSYDAKHMAKVVFWIHVVQFARPDQAVQQRSPLTTMVRAEEQEVLRPRLTARRAFSAMLLSAST